MKKPIFSIFLIYLFSIISPFSLNGATFTTISSGYWTNNNIWQNGIAPLFSTSDTVIIKNFIVLSSNLELSGPAHLRVDSTGALCGHDTIFSNVGTTITTYGILECDVLMVPGGHILFYPPGYIILSQYGQLSNGASLISTTNVSVGPWFDCVSKSSGIEESETLHLNVYPNPADDLLNISWYEFFDEYFISDLSGRVLQRGNQKISSLDISTLANGYYILTFKGNGNIFQKKFMKNSMY